MFSFQDYVQERTIVINGGVMNRDIHIISVRGRMSQFSQRGCGNTWPEYKHFVCVAVYLASVLNYPKRVLLTDSIPKNWII